MEVKCPGNEIDGDDGGNEMKIVMMNIFLMMAMIMVIMMTVLIK